MERTIYHFTTIVHFSHSHFTTYDLRRFAAKQTGPISFMLAFMWISLICY